MGTRVNVSLHCGDDDEQIIKLTANTVHPAIDFDKILNDLKMLVGQPTAQLAYLVNLTFPSTVANSSKGYRVFLLGDHHPDQDVHISCTSEFAAMRRVT